MLSVMTLNINGYAGKHGAWSERRAAIAEVILSSQTDVVALQGVRQNEALEHGLDQASQIKQLLQGSWQCCYFPATQISTTEWEGLAVLSKLPVLTHSVRLLTEKPAEQDPTKRLIQSIELHCRQQSLTLTNAHFSWVPAVFAENIADALPWLDVNGGYALLLGDFNAPPDAEPLRLLDKRGWIDLWPQFHKEHPGYTFETGELNSRIDYIRAGQAMAACLRSLERIGSFHDKAPGEVTKAPRLSDHLGLLARFEI